MLKQQFISVKNEFKNKNLNKMKYYILITFNLLTFCLIGQNTYVTNSGAFSSNELVYSVGEVYVNPINTDNANSGIIGVISRVEFFTLGINDELLSNDFRVFPNPTKKTLYFSTNIQFKEVYIYNINGKIVFHSTLKNNKIDLTNLSEGAYFIKTENPKFKTIKIIKN